MARRLYLCLIAFLMMFGCTSISQKKMSFLEDTADHVYGSLVAGRVDLGEKYAKILTETIPPKKRAPLPEFKSDKKYIVLPAHYQGTPTVVEDSPEYKEMLLVNEQLKKQVQQEQEQLDKTVARKESLIRETEQKLAAKSNSSWWGWFFTIGGGISFLGIIALCVFFPAAQPIVAMIFTNLISGFEGLIAMVANIFRKK